MSETTKQKKNMTSLEILFTRFIKQPSVYLASHLAPILSLRPPANLRESIEDVLDDASNSSVGGEVGFSDEEQAMLRNLLGFRDLRAEDVMVPRADIAAVDIATTPHELMLRFATSNHSRLPVFRENLDHPLGALNIKRVIAAYYKGDEKNAEKNNAATKAAESVENPNPPPPLPSVESLLDVILFVPPSMPCLDLLLKMQATRIHLALVIDEYGGTDGLLTLQDLIEEIVGDIVDDDEPSRQMLTQRAPHIWQAAARIPLAELQSALGLPFASHPLAAEADIDTLGGLIFAIAGRVPGRNEMVALKFAPLAPEASEQLVEFIIRDGDPRRIKLIDIRVPFAAKNKTAAEIKTSLTDSESLQDKQKDNLA